MHMASRSQGVSLLWHSTAADRDTGRESFTVQVISSDKDLSDALTVLRKEYGEWVTSGWLSGNGRNVADSDTEKLAGTSVTYYYEEHVVQLSARGLLESESWEPRQSNIRPAESGNIRNVREVMMYRKSTRPVTYYCVDETQWSEFSEEAIYPEDELIVNTKSQYRYSEDAFTGTPSMENFPVPDPDSWKHLADTRGEDWYATYAGYAASLGAIPADAYSFFSPEENIRLYDVLRAAVTLYRSYHGESAVLPGGDYAGYAIREGIIEEIDFDDYEKDATRVEVVYLLWNVLPPEELPATTEVTEILDIDAESRYYKCVLRLAQAGIISWPEPSYAFSPSATCTRAEVAAFVSRLACPELRAGK